MVALRIRAPERFDLREAHESTADLKDGEDLTADDVQQGAVKMAVPGETITRDQQFMRGHGTYANGEEPDVRASVLGSIVRVNKLLSVQPIKARFNPEIGDLVVGIVREVGLRKWKVDIGARTDATLQLASINLPGGIQRRKTGTDELQMRTFFQEGDLVLAEVQAYFNDGSVSLHTRSLKYGKLRNGQFVKISPGNVVRAKQSTAQLGDVDLVIGTNGYCFISMRTDTSLSHSSANTHNNTTQEASEAIYSNTNAEIPHAVREEIARIRNVLTLLDQKGIRLDVNIVTKAVERSRLFNEPGELLTDEAQQHISAQTLYA
ncbi:Exosome complex component rrp4 [Savitreella phatthalungensis]